MPTSKIVFFDYCQDTGEVVHREAPITWISPTIESDRDNETGVWKDFYPYIESLEEEFGVHDVGFSPDTELHGYSSYEIAKDRIDAHWNKFIAWFYSHSDEFRVGFTTETYL